VVFPNIQGVTHGEIKQIRRGSSPKEPTTGEGVVKRPPNTHPGSNHVPVTGKGS
jgi:hypothetical protein